MHGHIGWTWVKTAAEAIKALATGTVVKASLDHDLTVQQTIGNDDGEDTGFTVVEWMRDNGVWPAGGTKVHSMNASGKARMEAIIAKYSRS